MNSSSGWIKNPVNGRIGLRYFIIYLIDDETQSKTIRSCISAIRSILYSDGIELSDDTTRLNALVKACKLKNDRLGVKLSIQKGLLNMILEKIEDRFLEKMSEFSSVDIWVRSTLKTTFFFFWFRFCKCKDCSYVLFRLRYV